MELDGAALGSNEELADEITTLAAHLSAAMARWLALVAVFDERGAWAQWGCASCAHWIGWRCSISPSAAREHVRVARRLATLPVIQAAFARGELSYSKVRALTRLEAIDDEDALLGLALVHTAAQLDRVVRATRRVSREQAVDAQVERYLVLDPAEDGSVNLRGRLTTEDAAVLARALDLARESLREDGADADAGPANLSADALVRLADSVLVTGPCGRRTADRHEVVVHVDADALTTNEADETDGSAGAAPAVMCALDTGAPVAIETARRLCCDAGIVVHLERGGEPLAIGRRRRTIPPAIRRALRTRDRGCRFPGCTATRWLDAHHVEHWADGGATDLDNLVMLCGHHHKLVHEHGYRAQSVAGSVRTRGQARLRGGAPRVRFLTPAGRELEPTPILPGGDADTLVTGHRARGLDPGPNTPVPGWLGERLDLGLSVDATLGCLRPPPADGSAPTPTGPT